MIKNKLRINFNNIYIIILLFYNFIKYKNIKILIIIIHFIKKGYFNFRYNNKAEYY